MIFVSVILHVAVNESIVSVTVTTSDVKPLAGAVYVNCVEEIIDPETDPCNAEAVSVAEELTRCGVINVFLPYPTLADVGVTVRPGVGAAAKKILQVAVRLSAKSVTVTTSVVKPVPLEGAVYVNGVADNIDPDIVPCKDEAVKRPVAFVNVGVIVEILL